MPAPTLGWTARLTDLLGASPDQLDEGHLRSLVGGSVREDADLEFKRERYGNSDRDRRAFAGDVAAMANDRGGLIVIGIRDENDAAVELTPVELVDGEEGRLRQTAAGNLAPHVAFEIRVVATEDDPGRGYYLLITPPSPLRPHAVRKDRDLRYPLRDGSTTRWLSESEVADHYRDRFQMVTDQTGRIDALLSEGLQAMDTSEGAFVAVALSPTASGSMIIDAARVAALEQWARDMDGSAQPWLGFFGRGGMSPDARVGARRVTLAPIYDPDRPPDWYYAELHADGSGFACQRLSDPRGGPLGPEREGTWVLNEGLLFALARSLRFLGRHAIEHAGAWGDALAEARVIGSEMQLAYLSQPGPFARPIEGGRVLSGPVKSRHTLVLDDLVGQDQSLLASARQVAMDLFHAFGSAEVRHVAADGALNIGYFHDREGLRRLADERGVAVTD